MKRKIIEIDEDKCTGCGLCTQGCPEGAIKVVAGKARLVGDLYCDGLGACLGTCPEGAITVVEREAKPYDERIVMATIVKQGEEVIRTHLDHLRDHGQNEYLKEAVTYLKDEGIPNPQMKKIHRNSPGKGEFMGCPGSKTMDLRSSDTIENQSTARVQSQLKQWPIQLHLISPAAPYYQKADVVLAADCVAYALGGFHNEYLKGKALAIACPKLDEGQEYVDKIKGWFEDAKINTLTVMIMQVPCCMGLLRLAQQALQESTRKVPLKYVVVSVQGEVLQEEWA